MNLNKETVDFLTNLIENNNLTTTVVEDLREIIAQNGQTQAVEEPAPVVYLQPRSGLLVVSATNGVYDEDKHSKLFTGGIYNNTGENWNVVTTGNGETNPGKILANDLIKNGMYREFIKDVPENFFQGLEQALQSVEDNPVLAQEVLKQDRRLHLPFTNAQGARFVADVCEWGGKLKVDVDELSSVLMWDASYGYVVLFPQQEPLKIKS